MIQTNNGDRVKKKDKTKTKKKSNNKIYNSLRDDNNIMNRRVYILGIVIIVSFVIVSFKIFRLMVINNDYYKEKLSALTSDIVEGPSAPRGRIYDRNHKLLVDNKSVKTIYYHKQSKITPKEEIKLAKKIVKIINIDASKLSITNLKEFYIVDKDKAAYKKIKNDEWEKLKMRKLSLNDIENIKRDRVTNDDLKIYNDEDKKVAYIYYLMNKGYSYQDKIIKNKDVTDKEYAYIAEHVDELKGFNVKYDIERKYLYNDTFRSILGNLSTISNEDKSYYLSRGYSLNDIVGSSYIEKEYESILKGKKEKYRILSNNDLELIEEGKRGNDIVLTIDIKLQEEIEHILERELIYTKSEPNTHYFNSIFVVIEEPNTGEVLAMSGKQVINKNGKYEVIDYTPGVFTSPITPGSVVKGASMLVGYNTGAIKMGEYQYDDCIKLYSIPKKCSWGKLGLINDLDALAYSSNIYQFKTAMKVDNFKYSVNKKFIVKTSSINAYRKTFNELGLGVKTGLDLPVESSGNIGKNKSSDLYLNYAIGQYDTYTTMQLSQYINTIASNGNRLKPHLLKEVYDSSNTDKLVNKKEEIKPIILNKVNVDKKYLNRVKKGLTAVMDYGLGKNYMGDAPSPAGKTGTSESFYDSNHDGKVDVETLSNAFVGYAPSNKPVMSIAITLPNLVNPHGSSDLRSYANMRITKMISNKFFEIYK